MTNHVMFNSKGLLEEVRPLPHNVLQVKGDFQRCHYNPPCPRSHCTYAHSEFELQTWNKQKKEVLKCK